MNMGKDFYFGYRFRQVICGILGICIAAILTGIFVERRMEWVEAKMSKTQEELSEEVLRFHVLANSDSKSDQAVKLKVRDAVLAYMEENMAAELQAGPDAYDADRQAGLWRNPEADRQAGLRREPEADRQAGLRREPEADRQAGLQAKPDVKKTRAWVESHLSEIEGVADQVIKDNGYSYDSRAEVEVTYFPDKQYGDIFFPQGEYEALRLKLGNARGHNWWCVLYPSLCFTDTTCTVVSDEGRKGLKEALTAEEYEMVTATSEFKIKWFFFGDTD